MRSILCAAALVVAGGSPAGAQAPAAPAAPQATKPAWPGGIRPGTVLETVADSIALRTTYPPAGQLWFTAATRGKRLLLDIGRVDMDVRKDSARAQAYRLMVAKRMPIVVGTRLRLRGPFGALETEITGFDVWSSRVVATLKLTPAIDSLARKSDKLTASAQRTPAPADSAPAAGCVRDSLPPALRDRDRLKWVRDSLELVVRATPRPGYLGVSKKIGVRFTQAAGCFVIGRLVIAVSLRDDRNEWIVERLVLLDETGRVIPVKVSDLRFKGHEILGAFDADGDGVDDIATRAITEHAGAVTILRFDVSGKKFERLTAGFAWEDM